MVEDDPAYAEQLTSYLREYEKEDEEKISVQDVFGWGRYCHGGSRADYDIILMDVEMKFLDGMSAAEEIRKMDKEVVIIFSTEYAAVCDTGIPGGCFGLCVKPVFYFAFTQRIDRALTRLKKREKR